MKSNLAFAFVLCLAMMGAMCQVTAPQNNSERILAAAHTIETVAQTIGDARADGVITISQRDALLGRLQVAKDAVDAANALLNQGNVTGAEGNLATANAIIHEIRLALAEAER